MDYRKEKALTPHEACELLPGQPHYQTVVRWLKSEKLEGRKRGGRWYTSQEAIDRFMGVAPEPEANSGLEAFQAMTNLGDVPCGPTYGGEHRSDCHRGECQPLTR